jgi:hypothetical protein
MAWFVGDVRVAGRVEDRRGRKTGRFAAARGCPPTAPARSACPCSMLSGLREVDPGATRSGPRSSAGSGIAARPVCSTSPQTRAAPRRRLPARPAHRCRERASRPSPVGRLDSCRETSPPDRIDELAADYSSGSSASICKCTTAVQRRNPAAQRLPSGTWTRLGQFRPAPGIALMPAALGLICTSYDSGKNLTMHQMHSLEQAIAALGQPSRQPAFSHDRRSAGNDNFYLSTGRRRRSSCTTRTSSQSITH